MVCDAIAVCRAQVATTQTLKALTPNQIGEAIKGYLEQQGLAVGSMAIRRSLVTVAVKQPSFSVQFNCTTGEITSIRGWNVAFNLQSLLDEIVAWVGQVAGVAYQQKIAALLGKVGAVSSVTRSPGHHSALVVKMRMEV
jgi:hypothetical protein